MKKTFLSILIIISFFSFFRIINIHADGPVIVDPKKESGGWFYEDLNTNTRSSSFSSSSKCEEYRTDNKLTASTTKCYSVYKLLAPIGEFKEAPKNMGDYFNTIFKIAIGLCGALAVVMIVIGGVQYMGDESIFGKTEAKSKITSAILGLIIALGSYALLNTINPDLLGGKGVKITAVSAEIDPEVHGDTPQSSAVNGKYCNGRVVDGAEIDTVTNRKWKEDQTERTLLNNAGITIQRQNSCVKVGEKSCTSLTGLNTTPVISFKNKCVNCVVIINGATECWNHSPKTEHYSGNSIVDIDDTSSVDAYIQTGTKTRDSKDKYDIYEKDGIRFLDEGNHYHVISW